MPNRKLATNSTFLYGDLRPCTRVEIWGHRFSFGFPIQMDCVYLWLDRFMTI